MGGRVYSVGREIISMDWVELSLTVLSKTKDSALAEVIIMTLIPLSWLLITMSGMCWPQSRWGLGHGGRGWHGLLLPLRRLLQPLQGQVIRLILIMVIIIMIKVDQVHQAGACLQPVQPGPQPPHTRHRQPGPGSPGDDDNDDNDDNADNDDDGDYKEDADGCEEGGGGCHPRMLHGDNRLVQFNLQSNKWTNRGFLGRNNVLESLAGKTLKKCRNMFCFMVCVVSY